MKNIIIKFKKEIFVLAVIAAVFLAIKIHYSDGTDNGQETDTSHHGKKDSGKKNSGGKGGNDKDAPVPVLATDVTTADVPIYLQAVGTVQAYKTVTILPQVDGRITNIAFQEGQQVTKGTVLAQIDQAPYLAQLEQAKGKKNQDDAQLANAKLDLQRYEILVKSNAISKQQLATQSALVTQLQGQVQTDQGAVDNAQTQLDYTTIVSPIDGRTGIRMVDEGNVVHAAGSTGIVVITQVQPISVLFSLAQQNLPAVVAASQKGALTVDALGNDNKTIYDHGTLEVIDNQIDQTTGTVKLKATFQNANLQLWPGQFVNVKLLLDIRIGAIIVPTSAIQQGPGGAFVFIIGTDKTVTQRPVIVAQQDDTQAIIDKGLRVSEHVVTSGFSRLKEGSRIILSDEDEQDVPHKGMK